MFRLMPLWGVPAKVIRYRFDENTVERLLKIKWWDKKVSWLKANACNLSMLTSCLRSKKMNKILRFIRDHENIMNIIAMVYNFWGFNKYKRKRKLKFERGGVFMRNNSILNFGQNNTLKFGKGCRIYNSRIQFFGDNNSIIVDRDTVFKNVNIWISEGSIIEIGHNTHFTGDIHIACIEGKKVQIGERCLFSDQIVLRTGDSHSILDSSGTRINMAEDIRIGDHVWVGQRAVVLKGAEIGNGTVVGTSALVTGKKFGSNVILAGIPAKEIKENITWDHRLL